MKVYDGHDKIMGRLAAKIAQDLLDGEEVRVVNAEEIFLTGKKDFILQKYRKRRERGKQMNGPYYPRRPDRIFKRTIRGMLPYQRPRGRKAFKRLRVYVGTPEEVKGQDILDPDVKTSEGEVGITLADVSNYLGAKF